MGGVVTERVSMAYGFNFPLVPMLFVLPAFGVDKERCGEPVGSKQGHGIRKLRRHGVVELEGDSGIGAAREERDPWRFEISLSHARRRHYRDAKGRCRDRQHVPSLAQGGRGLILRFTG